MMRIGAVSLIGLAALAWLLLGAAPTFDRNAPPTIRAMPGPVKHRPEGYGSQSAAAQTIGGIVRRDTPTASPIDVNLILAR